LEISALGGDISEDNLKGRIASTTAPSTLSGGFAGGGSFAMEKDK